MEKKEKDISGWFNGWTSLAFLFLFIPCFQYFFNHSLFLQRNFSMVVATRAEVHIPDYDPRISDSPHIRNDGSQMIILTDKGGFIFQNQNFFSNVIDGLDNAEHIEIWYNADNRGVANIRTNQSDFIIPKTRTTKRLYLFALIFSSIALISGIWVVIKTKGWGDYNLLEKYPKGLLGTILDKIKNKNG